MILDIKKRLTNTNITLVQNDVESTEFKFLIKDGNRDYELVDQVELAIKKADGTFVVIPCSVSGSTATVTLTEQALTVPGRTLGEVRILSEEKVLTSTQFDFFVRENIINDKAIESTTEYGALQSLITEAQTVTAELTEARNALGNVDAIQAELQGASEAITQLIGDLNTKQAEVQELANTLTTKADTAQGVITSLDTIQPQITELQGLITQAQTLNTALNSLTATVNSANAVDGEIKASMQVVNGWIANPEQFKGEKGATGDRGPKGDTGAKGDKGEKGDMGTGIEILGSFTSESQLPSTANLGDAYMINGFLWVYDGTKWVNAGQIQGAKGDKGDTGAKGDTGDTGAKGDKGDTGATFTPTVNVDGDISWANDKGLANPTVRNIRGPQGIQGPQGPAGVNATTTEVATENADGLMSSEHVVALSNKQDTLTAGTNVAISGNTISATDTKYTAGTNVTISGNSISATDTTYGLATTSANGLMSSGDKTKLDELNYTRAMTEAAYEALSQAEKDRADVWYGIY